MTSLAMVIGLLPMMFAHGVGANGNSTLGAGAVGGYAHRYDMPDIHRSGTVCRIPDHSGKDQTVDMG